MGLENNYKVVRADSEQEIQIQLPVLKKKTGQETGCTTVAPALHHWGDEQATPAA